MAAGDIKFAGFPSAVVYESPEEGKKKGKKPVQHLMWGDWLKLKGGERGDWLEVHARNQDGWLHKDFIQDKRLLEFVFVDVGQGDGCIVTTPDDEQIIVDAGEEDNMYRFLRWRFGSFKGKFTFQTAIISHPDEDHFNGFNEFFDNKNVWFENIFHNGIVPRNAASDADGLGKLGGKGEEKFLLDVVQDRAALAALTALAGKKQYLNMFKKVVNCERITEIKMLSKNDGYLPGYGADKDLNIQVLGPVPEPDEQGNMRLRYFGDIGKTKNGHSIIIKLKYKNVRVFLGGDLNSESENFLLNHYTGLPSPANAIEEIGYIASARRFFEADIYKSCHHGSSDFNSLLLKAVNPIATVISSGDNEPYSHPRADALGAIGKHSRGDRPLIFSTELARSSNENIKSPVELKKELAKTETTDKKSQKLDKTISRSIAVYGAINVRTDGNDIMIAQKIEKPLRKDKEWDIYILKRQPDGGLRYESKYQ